MSEVGEAVLAREVAPLITAGRVQVASTADRPHELQLTSACTQKPTLSEQIQHNVAGTLGPAEIAGLLASAHKPRDCVNDLTRLRRKQCHLAAD